MDLWGCCYRGEDLYSGGSFAAPGLCTKGKEVMHIRAGEVHTVTFGGTKDAGVRVPPVPSTTARTYRRQPVSSCRRRRSNSNACPSSDPTHSGGRLDCGHQLGRQQALSKNTTPSPIPNQTAGSERRRCPMNIVRNSSALEIPACLPLSSV